MTKNELLNMIVEGATITAEMAEKAAELRAADEKAKEARKGKVSAKDLAKREENAKLATHVAEMLTDEPKTASDIAAALTAELGEEIKVQKANYLLRSAVTMGLASQVDVKVPKKGTQKGYIAIA